jgi:hypothetical protein
MSELYRTDEEKVADPLPKRETEYEESVDEEAHDSWPELYCPECHAVVSFCWSDLERGTEMVCDVHGCGYRWEVA